MSEMSSLSHEFTSTSDFSRELNDAVLVLKRASIRSPAAVDKPEIEQAVRRVRKILANLLIRFGEATEKASDEAAIPEDIVARIESNHSGERAYFVADVKRLASGLAPERPIDKSDLKLLDSICTAADASASATFRKLWRR